MVPGVIGSIVEGKPELDIPIDREKTCPLLLRVFCNAGRHHNIMQYSRGNVPANELHIYTWMDATLREITSLVKEVNPDARRKGTSFEFSFVFPDPRSPIYRMRDIGVTCAGQKGSDDNKTLAQARFCIGDYVDIAILTPNSGTPNRRNKRY